MSCPPLRPLYLLHRVQRDLSKGKLDRVPPPRCSDQAVRGAVPAVSLAPSFPLLPLSPGQANARHSVSFQPPLCLTKVDLSARLGSRVASLGLSWPPLRLLPRSLPSPKCRHWPFILPPQLAHEPPEDRAETLSNPSLNSPHSVRSPAQTSLSILLIN